MTKLLLLIAINILATGVLFALTKHANEPFIAPMSEISMTLRWVVIAAVIASLQFLAILGWRSSAKNQDDKTYQKETTSNPHKDEKD